MPETARSIRIAQTTALLSLTLGRDPRFTAWYDEETEDWGGMIGLTEYLQQVAAALEEQTDGQMALGEGVDWYLTVDRVADAILEDHNGVSLLDLRPYFYRWPA